MGITKIDHKKRLEILHHKHLWPEFLITFSFFFFLSWPAATSQSHSFLNSTSLSQTGVVRVYAEKRMRKGEGQQKESKKGGVTCLILGVGMGWIGLALEVSDTQSAHDRYFKNTQDPAVLISIRRVSVLWGRYSSILQFSSLS